MKPLAKANFNFEPMAVQKHPCSNTLRGWLFKRLLGSGISLDDIIQLVEKFDAAQAQQRGPKIVRSAPEYRAYQLIRQLHFHNGYGIKHDLETGLISVMNAP